MKQYAYVRQLIERYPALEKNKEALELCCDCITECYKNGGMLLAAGNGGSAADAEHIVGELMKGFVKKRKLPMEFAKKLCEIDEEYGKTLSDCLQQALPAIALCGHPALSTAFLNDVEGTAGFAQQVYGYGRPRDVLLAISTSGNSKNILYAAVAAKAKGMKVIGLTGAGGGRLKSYADIIIEAPETETYKIQEYHLPIYHALCLEVEEQLFEA